LLLAGYGTFWLSFGISQIFLLQGCYSPLGCRDVNNPPSCSASGPFFVLVIFQKEYCVFSLNCIPPIYTSCKAGMSGMVLPCPGFWMTCDSWTLPGMAPNHDAPSFCLPTA
jgi:hypothetical protein